MQRVVTPLDGSESAEQALTLALEMAQRFALPLHLVRVVDANDLPELRPEAGVEPVARELVAGEAMAEQYVHCVSRRLVQRGLTVTSEVRRGSAGAQILFSSQPGDVIVMARRGRGGHQPGLGSVAGKVVARAAVPVIVVSGAEAASRESLPCGRTLQRPGCAG
jgi:nucleotide-binding universal stress UspA family protein